MVGMVVSQLDNFRNLMWLCIGLEEAFDQQAISFIPDPNNILSRSHFKMIIWDKNILSKPLYSKSGKTIGDVSSSTIIDFSNLSVSPYRRCVSFQAFMSYWKWKLAGETRLDIPIDFDDSEYDDNKSMKQKRNEYLERYIRDTCDEGDIEDAFERKRKPERSCFVVKKRRKLLYSSQFGLKSFHRRPQTKLRQRRRKFKTC
jgi:hypothetical protein